MRAILLCPLLVIAACAAPSAKDLEKQPPAEVCYMGMTQPENKQMVDAELQRRKINCQEYSAEIKKIHDLEQRAGRMGEAVGEGTPKAGTNMGSGSSGGGMGRGY
jgi:hypothetical protein